ARGATGRAWQGCPARRCCRPGHFPGPTSSGLEDFVQQTFDFPNARLLVGAETEPHSPAVRASAMPVDRSFGAVVSQKPREVRCQTDPGRDPSTSFGGPANPSPG